MKSPPFWGDVRVTKSDATDTYEVAVSSFVVCVETAKTKAGITRAAKRARAKLRAFLDAWEKTA